MDISGDKFRSKLVLTDEPCKNSLFLARELDLEVSIYEGGILRVWIDERHTGKPNRFRLSTHDMGSILNQDLRQLNLRELIVEESEDSATFVVKEEDQIYTFQI